jgi:hypothetical protein
LAVMSIRTLGPTMRQLLHVAHPTRAEGRSDSIRDEARPFSECHLYFVGTRCFAVGVL